jgi:hypothetical protein
LEWLARSLKNVNETELLIEKMQPSWLDDKEKKRYQRATYSLLGQTLAISSGIAFGFLVGLVAGLSVWAIMSLIYSFSEDDMGEINPVETIQLPFSQEARRKVLEDCYLLLIGVPIYGLIAGAFMFLISALVSLSYVSRDGWALVLRNLLTVSLFIPSFGLAALLGGVAGLIPRLVNVMKQELKIRAYPNQGIWNSMQIMIITTLLSYPFGLVLSTIFMMICRKNWSLPSIFFTAAPECLLIGFWIAILFGLGAGGGAACFGHLCLRIILIQNRRIPWCYVRFLNYCTERRLLQRVGGRYRFIHRELLEHLAK